MNGLRIGRLVCYSYDYGYDYNYVPELSQGSVLIPLHFPVAFNVLAADLLNKWPTREVVTCD